MIYLIFFKQHSKSFSIDPSAPIIIGIVDVSLSHILAISNRNLEQLFSFFISFQNHIIIDGTRNINYQTFFRILFHNHNIWPPMFYLSIHLNTDIPQNFHNIIYNFHAHTTFHILLLYTSCIKPQQMFKHTLSCVLLYSFCANILQPLTMCRTFSTLFHITCIYLRYSYDKSF